jgi:hypothetical protein
MLLERLCFGRPLASSSPTAASGTVSVTTAADSVVAVAATSAATILGETIEAGGDGRCCGYEAEVVGARERKVEGRRMLGWGGSADMEAARISAAV